MLCLCIFRTTLCQRPQLKNLKWFGQAVTDLWMDKQNDKERVCMHLTGIAR